MAAPQQQRPPISRRRRLAGTVGVLGTLAGLILTVAGLLTGTI